MKRKRINDKTTNKLSLPMNLTSPSKRPSAFVSALDGCAMGFKAVARYRFDLSLQGLLNGSLQRSSLFLLILTFTGSS